MSEVSWHFPVNGGGVAAGFNDSSTDHFKGDRLSSLVREVIQNSIDARDDRTQPVVVDFQFDSLQSNAIPEIVALTAHFELACATAKVQCSDQAVEFYKEAVRTANQREIQFLTIHDSNTTGLTGPLEGPSGAWYALTKGSGLTQKPGPSLGSFGHGSKAPFASSKFRTIFYLSLIKSHTDQTETRFQGKSTLQSYSRPNGEMTQGTGFYGNSNRCQPLIDEFVPTWVQKLRMNRIDKIGTSIIIPGTIWYEDSVEALTITAIANFFYAIWKGVLEVNIGSDYKLNAANIVEKYKSFKVRLNQGFKGVDMESISDLFDTIETIVSPSYDGEQQIQTFGRVDWYFRAGDNVDGRNVAVARGNGMLITKRAPHLVRFPGLKPFDFFVCVTGNGGDGSELLKSIENPEHTNFEFDRIDDPKKRSIAKKKYENFHRAVREILKKYASYSTLDQVVVDELQDLFNDISGDIDSPGGSIERGGRIQIATGGFIFRRREESNSIVTHDTDGKPGSIPGMGMRGGTKKAQSKGGTLPSECGRAVIVGPSKPSEGDTEPPKVVPLRNLRMRPSNQGKNYITLLFDTPFSGPASLKLTKVGEIGGEPIMFILDRTSINRIDVCFTGSARTEVTVELAESAVDFAIEGEAYEVKSQGSSVSGARTI